MIGNKGPFPEKQHTKHKPGSDSAPHFTKKSEHVGRGHEDSMNRLPDPNVEWGNEETGEGKG